MTDMEHLQQCNFWLCNIAIFIVYYFHVNLLTSSVVRYLKNNSFIVAAFL